MKTQANMRALGHTGTPRAMATGLLRFGIAAILLLAPAAVATASDRGDPEVLAWFDATPWPGSPELLSTTCGNAVGAEGYLSHYSVDGDSVIWVIDASPWEGPQALRDNWGIIAVGEAGNIVEIHNDGSGVENWDDITPWIGDQGLNALISSNVRNILVVGDAGRLTVASWNYCTYQWDADITPWPGAQRLNDLALDGMSESGFSYDDFVFSVGDEGNLVKALATDGSVEWWQDITPWPAAQVLNTIVTDHTYAYCVGDAGLMVRLRLADGTIDWVMDVTPWAGSQRLTSVSRHGPWLYCVGDAGTMAKVWAGDGSVDWWGDVTPWEGSQVLHDVALYTPTQETLLACCVGEEGYVTTLDLHQEPATLAVPDDYETIQAAVLATATDTDMVLVHPGVYFEHDIDLRCTLLSSSGPEDTIIDCQGVGGAFTIDNAYCHIGGFTVRNGHSNNGSCAYVRIESPAGHITFENMVVEDCTGGVYGIGVWASTSVGDPPVTLRDVTIHGNTATEYTSWRGSAIWMEHCDAILENVNVTGNAGYGSEHVVSLYSCGDVALSGCAIADNNQRGLWLLCDNATLQDVSISGNEGGMDINGSVLCERTSVVGNSGGGVEIWNGILDGCVISGNSDMYSGGGIYAWGGTVRNCVITGNRCDDRGGGIFIRGASVSVENCTIAGNFADFGGGAYLWAGSGPTLSNTILWGSCAASEGDQIYQDATPGPVAFLHSLIDTMGTGGALAVTWGEDNLYVDPLFCAPLPCTSAPSTEGEHGLYDTSPCLPENNSFGELIGALEVGCDASSTDDEGASPLRISVSRNHPNPFTPATTLCFRLPERAHVHCEIRDVCGRLVRTLIDRECLPGEHALAWHGNDVRGHRVPRGVYFYRFESCGYASTGKMIYVR